MQGFENVKKYASEVLSEKRFQHTVGVAEEARRLAVIWGENPDKAYLSGLIHDIAKELDSATAEKILAETGEKELFGDMARNVALHGYLAAYLAEKELGVTDEDVLMAARYHTTGRIGMSLLEKIIYVADFTEPGRHYPQSREVRDISEKDIDAAVLKETDYVIKFIIDSGRPLCTDTVDVRNSFLQKKKCR